MGDYPRGDRKLHILTLAGINHQAHDTEAGTTSCGIENGHGFRGHTPRLGMPHFSRMNDAMILSLFQIKLLNPSVLFYL